MMKTQITTEATRKMRKWTLLSLSANRQEEIMLKEMIVWSAKSQVVKNKKSFEPFKMILTTILSRTTLSLLKQKQA